MNKRMLIIGLLACVVLFSVGCQKESEKPDTIKPKLGLPLDITGVWQARESPWRIVLGPDGTVTSAVIPMGTVTVQPRQTTKVEMKDGSWSTYTAGDCPVKYKHGTRELFVVIEMADINIVYMTERIKGTSTDRFIGAVSDDGKVWRTDWISLFDYGPRFPQDPNDVYSGTLIFDKVPEDPNNK